MIDSEGSSSDLITKNKTNQQVRNVESVEKVVDTKVKEKWAVIIGISKYKDSSINLEYADRDAQGIYDILTQEKDGFFKKDHIIKLINEEATVQKIRSALSKFLKKPDKDDLFLLYFACHGSIDPEITERCYILPYDTDLDELESTSLPMDQIRTSIRDYLKAERKIIIADACHSGNIVGDGTRSSQSLEIVNNYLKALANSLEGTALLTSAEAREVAREGKEWGGGHGVFTHYIIEGMKGEADGYGGGQEDGIISIGELFEYVSNKVREATSYMQHPLIGSSPFDRKLPIIFLESVKQKFAELEAKIISEINQGNYAEVNLLSDKAIELDPKNHLSYFYKGYADELLKNYNQAIQNYDKSIQVKEDFEKAYFRKGQVLQSLDNKEQAILCFDKAAKINPTYYEAVDAKRALNLEIAKTVKKQQIIDQVEATEEATESKISESYYRKSQDHIDSFKTAEPKRAIVIGINEYENPDIPVLKGAKNDAIELRNILMNPNLGFSIADYHFLGGKEATYNHVINAILDLFGKYADKSTELILFYFSGYGLIDIETMQAYIAPYDFDPVYPEFFGVKMDVLRNAASSANTKANILMIFDCLFVPKGEKSISSQTKNIYAEDVLSFPLNKNQLSQDKGNSILLIASSAADLVSRERACVDLDASTHTHGVLTYHLIQGLEGGAANNLGLITFDSLKGYLMEQMKGEGKNRPLHTVLAEPIKLDKIRIGKSVSIYRGKIQEFIRDAKEYSTKSDLRALRAAAQNIKALEELDIGNAEIPGIIQNVNETLENMHVRETILEWLKQNESDEFLHVDGKYRADSIWTIREDFP